MKVSMSASAIMTMYGIEGGIKMLADAGFEAVDFPLYGEAITPWDDGFYRDPFCEEFEQHFKRVKKVIADHGLEAYQSHAPYCAPNCSDPEKYAVIQRHTVRAIYAGGYMECPHIVAHPVLHPDFLDGQNRERAIQTNLEYFGKFAPALKDTGVIMCIENLFWGDPGKPKFVNACSDADQLGALIDMLNDQYGPYYGACLDVGHAVVAGNDPTQMLKALGERTRVLHLQDNGGVKDDHWLPARGVIRWDEFLPALQEIGYRGTFNMEIYFRDFQKDPYNKNVHQAACALFYAVGRSMADLADGIGTK